MSKVRKKNTLPKTIPYARGFKRPTAKQAENACGNSGELDKYLKNNGCFKPVAKCTSQDDWLAQYPEVGQRFQDFKQTCPWLSKRKRKSVKQEFVATGKTIMEKYPEGMIYLLPLGEFNKTSIKFELLSQYASIFFKLPVTTMPKVSLTRAGKDEFKCTVQGSAKEFR